MLNQFKKVAVANTPRWVVLTIDLLLATLSFGVASLIAALVKDSSFTVFDYIYPFLFVLCIRLVAFLITKSYTGIIRYTSTQDAVRIFFAVLLSTAIILGLEALLYLSQGGNFVQPIIVVIDSFILIFLLSGFRILFKLIYHQYGSRKKVNDYKKVIIYGAGETGIIVKRSFESDTKGKRRVIAFLDDNTKLQGKW